MVTSVALRKRAHADVGAIGLGGLGDLSAPAKSLASADAVRCGGRRPATEQAHDGVSETAHNNSYDTRAQGWHR